MKDTRKIGVIHITLYNFIAKAVFFIFLFFVSSYASRKLSEQQFGIAQYITWTVNFTWLIFNFGGASALQRFMASAYMQQHKSAVRKYLLFGVFASVVSTSTALLAWKMYTVYNPEIQHFPGFYLFLIFQFAVSYMQVVAQSFFRYKAIFYINLLSAVSGISFLILSIDAYQGYAYVWMYILINIIQFICYGILIIKTFRQIPDDDLVGKETPVSYSILIKTSGYFGASAILAALLWQRPELYLVKMFLGFDKVAAYSIALNTISLMLEPLKMLSGAMLSYFAGISHLKEKVERQFYVFFKHYTWLAMFTGVFLWFESETIVTFIYTAKYIQSAYLVKLLLIGFIPGVCSHLIMHLLVGLRRTRYLVTQDVIIALLFVSVAIFGVNYFSLSMMSLAKSALFLLSFTMAMLYLLKRLKFHLPLIQMASGLVISILLFFFLSFIPFTSMWISTGKLLAAGAIYLLISIKFRLVDVAIISEVFLEVKKLLGINKH